MNIDELDDKTIIYLKISNNCEENVFVLCYIDKSEFQATCFFFPSLKLSLSWFYLSTLLV